MIGIYEIHNTVTHQRYIGRSARVGQRLGQHRRALRDGKHSNPYLQASFCKYGEATFTFRPVLKCRREDAAMYEVLAIAAFHAHERKHGYNMTDPVGDTLTHQPEAKARIAAASKARQAIETYERTPEIREAIATALRGKVGCNKGRTFAPDKRGGAPVGNQNRLGKALSAEVRATISVKISAKILDPEYREKLAAAKRGKKQDPEAVKRRIAKVIASRMANKRARLMQE